MSNISTNKTLNQLTTILASKAGDKYDFSRKKELGRIFDYVRAFFMRRALEKKSHDRKHFTSTYKEEMVKVDNPFKSGTKILRSKERIPETLRANGILFDSLSSLNGEAIQHIYPEEVPFMLANTYTGDRVKYSYVDGYVYIFNNLRLCDILIRGIFASPSELLDCDNDYYPMPEDLITPIMEYIMKNELRLNFDEEEKEIKDETHNRT